MGNDRRKNQTNYRKGNLVTTPNFKKREYKTKEKEGFIIRKGVVKESYTNARFLVQIEDSELKINATLAGKIRQNFIKILPGDKVEIELSIYDLSQGRISRRL